MAQKKSYTWYLKKAISERHFQMPRDSSGNVPPKVGVWIPRILILFFGWEFGTLKFLRRWEWEKSDSLWGMLETSGKIDSPKVSERILGKSPSPLKGFNVSKMVCSCLCSSHFFYFTIKIIWSKTATSTQWVNHGKSMILINDTQPSSYAMALLEPRTNAKRLERVAPLAQTCCEFQVSWNQFKHHVSLELPSYLKQPFINGWLSIGWFQIFTWENACFTKHPLKLVAWSSR